MCTTERNDLGLTDANASCACCATDAAPTESFVVANSVSAEVLVDGMTCGHCAQSVTKELAGIDGVSGVDVKLNVGGSSTVTVKSTAPIAAEQINAAIEEAGYSVTTSPA
jgi:copper chaperone CopZ